ncbi:hypothetical protein FM106_12620 [Brachybacterium faecium]|nr:hypothetical protein FM106_12620 [Brachybacterium faecium]
MLISKMSYNITTSYIVRYSGCPFFFSSYICIKNTNQKFVISNLFYGKLESTLY